MYWLQGNGVSIIHRFPYSAINFSVYEFLRSSFRKGDMPLNEAIYKISHF